MLRAHEFVQVPLFQKSGFTDEQYAELAKQFQHRSFSRRQHVIQQGDVGDTFFLLAEGEVKVTKDGVEVATLEPGACFGEGHECSPIVVGRPVLSGRGGLRS